tara:strand:- start:2 stop:148 length:147 start_codon:yes stop_codon:yes gene_type:complete
MGTLYKSAPGGRVVRGRIANAKGKWARFAKARQGGNRFFKYPVAEHSL